MYIINTFFLTLLKTFLFFTVYESIKDYLLSNTATDSLGKRKRPSLEDVANHVKQHFQKQNLVKLDKDMYGFTPSDTHITVSKKIASVLLNEIQREEKDKRPKLNDLVKVAVDLVENLEDVTEVSIQEKSIPEKSSDDIPDNEKKLPAKETDKSTDQTVSEDKEVETVGLPSTDNNSTDVQPGRVTRQATAASRAVSEISNETVELTETLQHLRTKFSKLRNIKLTEELSKASLSIDLDSSLFILGLLVIREKNIDDMIVGEILADDKKLEKEKVIKNPVYFGPQVNHHNVQHYSLSADFLNTAYSNSGKHSITDNNKVQVALYSIRNYVRDETDEETWFLESFFSANYKTANLQDHSTMVEHKKKVGACIMTREKDVTFNDRLEFIFEFLNKLHHRNIRSHTDLISFGETLGIKLEEDKYKSVKGPNAKFSAAYEDLAVAIQTKYKFAIGIPEGLHRLTVTLRAAYSDIISNAYHFDTTKKNKTPKLWLSKTPLSDSCSVRFLLGLDRLPKQENLQQLSSDIRKGQNLGHNKTMIDQIHQCLNFFHTYLNNHNHPTARDCKHEDWYQSSNSSHNDPARQDMRAFLKDIEADKKTEAKNNFKRRSDEILKTRMENYSQYNETQDQHTFIASLILPKAYDLMLDYFGKFEYRLGLVNNISTKPLEDIHFALFKFAQLSEHNKMIVMKTEYTKTSGSGELRFIHYNIRVLLHFLRYMLMFKQNRIILRNYASKSEFPISWKQEQSLQKGFFPTDIYRFELVEKMMEITSHISTKFTEYVISNVPGKNAVKKNKLGVIFQEATLVSIFSGILKIGCNPAVNQELLKSKIGAEEYAKHFEQQGRKVNVEFLLVMLDLYFLHVTTACQTQPFLKKKIFEKVIAFLRHYKNNEGKKVKGIDRFGNSTNVLKQNDFQISDFKLDKDTRDIENGYRFEKDTVVPGSFYNFVRSLAESEKEPLETYEKFSLFEEESEDSEDEAGLAEQGNDIIGLRDIPIEFEPTEQNPVPSPREMTHAASRNTTQNITMPPPTIPHTQIIQEHSNLPQQHNLRPRLTTPAQLPNIQFQGPSTVAMSTPATTTTYATIDLQQEDNDRYSPGSTATDQSGQTQHDYNSELTKKINRKLYSLKSRQDGLTIEEYFSECIDLIEQPYEEFSAGLVNFKSIIFQNFKKAVPEDIQGKKFKF